MDYTNPGERFVQQFGPPQELEDVLRYARWLRMEAKIGPDSAIDLSYLYAHFHIPKPKRTPLPGQQGILVSSEIGLILINEDDPFMRQRFSEAHEIMELLFEAAATENSRRLYHSTPERLRRKEHWCDEGAAELLLPRSALAGRIQTLGVSFDAARSLAAEFEVSLTVSLLQIIKASENHYAIVCWRLKHKPSEMALVDSAAVQLSMFGETEDLTPKKRLRVEWSHANSEAIFIPAEKSIAEESTVYAAWREGVFTSGNDVLDLGRRTLRFRIENQPFEVDGERRVLSLVTLID